nr:hypothetical protein [Tanacetum cinerariifolium]
MSIPIRKLRPSYRPKDFPLDSRSNPLAHPIPTYKLALLVKVKDPFQEQRADPFKKVKKDGGSEHNQGESKKGKEGKTPLEYQSIRRKQGSRGSFGYLLGGGRARGMAITRLQKRYDKDPTKIHSIKRRQNEGLQAFMNWFKSESSQIKGVSSVLRISAFMHGHGHPVPEKARNKGGPREARRNMGVYTPYTRKDTFTLLIKTPKEILIMESVSFPEPLPLIETPKKQNLNKLCDYHEDRGHNTNDYYQLKNQIEEAVAPGKLAHLVKDILRNNQRNMNKGRNGMKVINMIREEGNHKRHFEEGRSGVIKGNQVQRILVDGGSSSEIMYEHCFRNLDIDIRSRLRRCKALMIGSKSTAVLRFVIEHQLKMYSLAELVVHKKRPVAPEGRLALKERGNANKKVIKSKSEQNLFQDVKEMLRNLKRVNIKIDSIVSSFGVKEGKFLGHMVTKEGLRAYRKRIQEIALSPTPRSPNQIRSLFLQPTAISKFISKLAELKHPIHEARMRMETAKESG